jgi:predicted PhzF superfamily epimerase YddE/YHI9
MEMEQARPQDQPQPAEPAEGEIKWRLEIARRTLATLATVGRSPPEEFLNKYPHQLSGGQRQRLCSRRARRGVIATAAGREVEFVSRFFAPKYGIPEDTVTGSAHCELTPFWAPVLGKDKLHARQVSRRGGDVYCELKGSRVILAGSAVTFMEAEICIG